MPEGHPLPRHQRHTVADRQIGAGGQIATPHDGCNNRPHNAQFEAQLRCLCQRRVRDHIGGSADRSRQGLDRREPGEQVCGNGLRNLAGADARLSSTIEICRIVRVLRPVGSISSLVLTFHRAPRHVRPRTRLWSSLSRFLKSRLSLPLSSWSLPATSSASAGCMRTRSQQDSGSPASRSVISAAR